MTIATSGETRRGRQRRQLVDDLCVEARRQLAVGGTGSITWRGLARAVGMSPASLYTYFANIDELLTELILRTYADLASAVQHAATAFADAPLGDRLLVGPYAYRRWALAHRPDFNLIFTDQLPGYAAEPGGLTVSAQTLVFAPMAAVVGEAMGWPQPPGDDLAAAVVEHQQTVVGLWAGFHGFVTLEVNHHLDWMDSRAAFERTMRQMMAFSSLPAATPTFADSFDHWVLSAATVT